ncbi:MAG TPA: glycosyltransferase family 4 protein, partial [Acidimicrobiales bacterium]|nr:glycosyltransferase family 4 protein [Acidimicrobiales bacterium]
MTDARSGKPGPHDAGDGDGRPPVSLAVVRPATTGASVQAAARVGARPADLEAAAPSLDEVVARAGAVGLHRVHLLGWRDIEDPEAGGSELHAHRIATRWASAGLEVTLRTSHAAGQDTFAGRDGYRVVRKSGRYAVFPRSALSGWLGRDGRPDGLVEIWNGMPFFSPLWARCARIVFLHHVHAEMWRMVLTPGLARVGEAVERHVAPLVYRRSRVVTLSSSSRDEIVEMLGLRPSRVSVVAPGLDPGFTPGGERDPAPLVVAVGRLVPVKRFDLLIGALVRARRSLPALRAVIVGEGYERPRLEAMIEAFGAGDWISLPGHLPDEEVRSLYRRAWVLASTSLREGWGMTVTEAAACGTPAVATRIAGHMDAVHDGTTGLLAGDTVAQFAGVLSVVLGDEGLRARLGA